MSRLRDRNLLGKLQAKRASQRDHRRPTMEILEDRTLPSTCNVTRLTDTGMGMGFRGDLRYCINKTNSTPGEDVILFQVTGTINLTGVLPNINDTLTIFGPGVDQLTVRRDTGGQYRIFTVNEGKTASIYNLTATNGTGGILNLGTLELAFVAVTGNNNTLVDGGGVTNVGNLTVFGSTISGNTGTLSGGAKGAGIFNLAGATATVSFSTISGNVAASANNSGAGGSGGGIYNQGSMFIEYSTIADNKISCMSDQNICNVKGGGIANFNSMTIAYSMISGNKASGDHPVSDAAAGAGIYNIGTLTVDSSTIASNVVGSIDTGHVFGGGISSDGTLTLINSTVAGNIGESKQDCRGGGIHVKGGPTTIRNSTIVGNFCGAEKFEAEGGGMGITGSPIVDVRNTIVALNFAATSGPDLFGILTTSGFNVFPEPSGGSGYDPTDLLNVDPLLGDFGDYGGPTPTYPLLPGSPAINAGDNTDAPEFDQRGPGFPRIVGGTIDIGSFEVQAITAPSIRATTRPLLSVVPIPHVVREFLLLPQTESVSLSERETRMPGLVPPDGVWVGTGELGSAGLASGSILSGTTATGIEGSSFAQSEVLFVDKLSAELRKAEGFGI